MTLFLDVTAKTGHHTSLKFYPILFSDHITACIPKPQKISYMYVLRMRPDYEPPISDVNLLEIHKLYSSNNNFAILTSKCLPKIGLMKLYSSFGRIQVELVAEPIPIKLENNTCIEKLHAFHKMIFNDLLQLKKRFLMADFENAENAYFIVPLQGQTSSIDWALVDEFQQLQPFSEYSNEDRKKMKFTLHPNDYIHQIISPWYRADKGKRYVVTKVHEHLTPYSAFPSDSYDNYAAYIEDKYSKTIIHTDQFLIEVKMISTDMNCLNDDRSDSTSIVKTEKIGSNRGPEVLIPELCHNFKFPGDLCLKAMLLPSVLHRLHYILHAESIRTKIVEVAEFACDAANYEPEPLSEQMKYRSECAKKHKNIVPARPIMIPNPDETVPIQVENNDFIPISSTIECPWQAYTEPNDFDRNLDTIFPFEIEYYVNFINKKLTKMNLLDIDADGTVNELNNKITVAAICDSESSEKRQINILNISDNTPVQGPRQSDILVALTAPLADDSFSMTRFEFLGNAFLQFACSFYLLHHHNNWHVGFLKFCKSKLLSVANLNLIGQDLALPSMIKVFKFNPINDWIPPLVSVPREIQGHMRELKVSPHLLYRLDISDEENNTVTLSQDTMFNFISKFLDESDSQLDDSAMNNFLTIQPVADDIVASSLVSIVGCSFASMGIERTFRLIKLFNILPKDDCNLMMKLQFKNPRLRKNISDSEITGLMTNYEEIEKRLEYTFKDKAYLLQALTHTSFPRNNVTDCYQTLAFIGRAVYQFLVFTYLFEKCDHLNSAQLDDVRAALIRNCTLACICVRNSFHLHILMQNAVLAEKMGKFVAFQQHYKHKITNRVMLLIEETDMNMGELVDMPELVGEILEAIIGAVFLDSGNDLFETWRVCYNLINVELHQFINNVPPQLLQQLDEFQGANAKFDDPVKEDDVVMVTLRFTNKNQIMQVKGFGTNAKEAKEAAAKIALNKLLL